ncbi:unnamed protein product [Discula destructiva]
MSLRSLWTVRQAAGEPHAVVRVRQLATACIGPQDAWGRPNATQPVTVCAELHFSRPFEAAVAADRVTDGDTVHYGQLSKLILACVERSNEHALAAASKAAARSAGNGSSGTGGGAGVATSTSNSTSVDLRVLLEMIWIVLTGRNVNGDDAAPEAKPLLDLAKLRFMSLTVTLPKASLLGEGVSLTAANVFPPQLSSLSMYALALKVHRLRVPTLIGVNANERLAKQFVVADVELDRFDYYPDLYCELEGLVVKATEKSSFETLEALGAHLASTVIKDLKPNPKELVYADEGWQVKLSMEKPSAVPFAECPVVEMRVSSRP